MSGKRLPSSHTFLKYLQLSRSFNFFLLVAWVHSNHAFIFSRILRRNVLYVQRKTISSRLESVFVSCFRVVLDVLALFCPSNCSVLLIYRVATTLESDVRALSCYYFAVGYINFETFWICRKIKFVGTWFFDLVSGKLGKNPNAANWESNRMTFRLLIRRGFCLEEIRKQSKSSSRTMLIIQLIVRMLSQENLGKLLPVTRYLWPVTCALDPPQSEGDK